VKPKDEHKQQQILQATLALVEEQGIAGLSMAMVAKKAKVATGTVYIYFESKEALLNHLYISVKRRFADSIFNGCSEGDPVKLCFQKICHAYIDYLLENYAAMVFMHQFVNSPFVAETSVSTGMQYMQPLVELMERGKKEMLFKNLDTMFMISFLHGSISEFLGFLKRQPKPSYKNYYAQMTAVCWDGLKA
jgi:AcrR family transcriptional regulator